MWIILDRSDPADYLKTAWWLVGQPRGMLQVDECSPEAKFMPNEISEKRALADRSARLLKTKLKELYCSWNSRRPVRPTNREDWFSINLTHTTISSPNFYISKFCTSGILPNPPPPVPFTLCSSPFPSTFAFGVSSTPPALR